MAEIAVATRETANAPETTDGLSGLSEAEARARLNINAAGAPGSWAPKGSGTRAQPIR